MRLTRLRNKAGNNEGTCRCRLLQCRRASDQDPGSDQTTTEDVDEEEEVRSRGIR